MAVAAYDSDLTVTNSGELTDASNAANWDESTDAGYDDGGGMVDETNFYIQGVECISAQFTKTGVGTIINIQGGAFTVDTDGAILIWGFWASPTSLATYANGGVRTLVGNTLGDFYTYKASGSDFEPNPFGGWYNYAINPDVATIDATVGSPDDTWTHVGIAINATAQARGNPFAVDAIRVGRCTMEVTDGQAAAYGTFVGMASFDDSSGERYALFQTVPGGYRWQGLMSLGLTGIPVDFRDSNANIVIANTPMVSANFNKIEIHHASSNVEWTAININAYGVNSIIAPTASAGSFEMVDNATVAMTSCIFTDMLTFVFQSNATLTNTSFNKCGQITHGGAIFDTCVMNGYEGTADTAYMTYAVAVDPDGELDNCSFIKGTASTHAIEFDATNTPTTITLRGIDFSGYNAANGNTDSTLYFPSTTKSYTVNLIGCTGDISYKVGTGGSVTLVTDPVTLQITVKDIETQAIVVGARVLAKVADGTNFPYNDSVVINSSGTTATVTHTGHGLATNDNVVILGATLEAYNGVYTITVTDVDTYTYTMVESATSPAAGTPVATMALINGVTDGTGKISDSRTYPTGDQPIVGKSRKATSGTLYKQQPINETVLQTSGLAITVQMIPDE